MSIHCDGCQADDPFECGERLAAAKRTTAVGYQKTFGVCSYVAQELYAMAAELEECGCVCACHGELVDQPATASAGGGT